MFCQVYICFHNSSVKHSSLFLPLLAWLLHVNQPLETIQFYRVYHTLCRRVDEKPEYVKKED